MYSRPLAASALSLLSTPLLLSAPVLAQSPDPSAPTADRSAAAPADQMVEEIVVTGTLSRYGAAKAAVPIVEAVRSISIETEQQFRDKGALTLDDTLNYTAGVVGDTFGFSSRGDFPTVRGFDAAEYRDGLQVLFGSYNNTRSDVYFLDQVEVLKGPASVLYGKGTPGGIVNAISKLAGPDEENELLVDIGNRDRYQVSGDLNADLGNNLYARLVGIYRNSGSQVDFVHDDALIFMPSITYETARTSITAMAEVIDRDGDTAHQFLPLTGTGCVSDQVTVSPAAFCANATGQRIEDDTYLGDPGFNRYDTNSTMVSLLGHHDITDWVTLEGVARYKKGRSDYRQAWIGFTGGPRIDAQGNGARTFYVSDSESEQAAVDVRARWQFETGPLRHELFTGIAYQHVQTDNDTAIQRGVGVLNAYRPVYGNVPADLLDPAALADGPEQTAQDLGLYVNNQISLGRWRANLGLRYDDTETRTVDATDARTEQDDSAASFSAGLLYKFDFGLSPYASFAESFNPVIGTDGLTAEPLKPREGRQWEVGLKYQPPGTPTFITVALFDIKESNLPNPSSLIDQPDSQQEGDGRVRGVEIEALTRWRDWSFEANYSYLDTENADGVDFDSVPSNQASAWVQYAPSAGLLDGFRVGGGLRYQGENRSTAVVGGVPAAEIVTDGVVLGDILVGYRYRQWDVTLNMRNVTDKSYYGTCLARGDCFPGERRTIVARLGYHF
ncbi:iron complex outermembrane receptor protein [Rhodothalassium salexigens DSM 2132]|uniref:Iron complex outermembrane receptor protein n=1 Tax=Rhodothalassium salexigens DSM 2132 TaxID=1188247 RepID=A0A4R2PL58_RHOSA|nr:TonB-dependent siderophore receptor [Rhodothalassium salexigens]MBB4211022.1 iron complex outermembrane receptor protein [Rhodothalassium salexigens DSM 2132]TCP36320.1 iron complex outermembrane receptor protein [Rhodothalassium salexigens DSM 2132]